jgi:hypothetical protein
VGGREHTLDGGGLGDGACDLAVDGVRTCPVAAKEAMGNGFAGSRAGMVSPATGGEIRDHPGDAPGPSGEFTEAVEVEDGFRGGGRHDNDLVTVRTPGPPALRVKPNSHGWRSGTA